MKTCATCTYWESFDPPSILGSCLMPKFKYGYNLRDSKFPEDGAVIENDEGWGMYTGRGFGCIHHCEEEVEG